jgi:hypothetical protein
LRYLNVITDLFLVSAIYAGIINLINTLAAIKLFDISFKSGTSFFMIYTLGGLGVRLMLLLIIFVIVIKFLNIDNYAFILVFFLFYFISLGLEVIFYLKKANNNKKS